MRITLKKQIDHLFQLFVIIIVIVLASWIIFSTNGTKLHLAAYSVPFIFIVMPTLVVHINYFLKNRRYDFEILEDEIRISIDKKEYRIKPNETSEVKYVISPEMYETRHVWLPWNYYRHVEIYMNDGGKFVITSLLTDDFSWLFHHGFNYETKINFYRLA
ncbi:MAG: hypothetical protein JJ971_02650 [Balneolaceae bacterium]|nr:hypothetical protein [Balneolaceae bacterium]MBO6545269.1 hypothetical protein [Balneolaceae bacterium]MBO6646665.1 hypothetical protein [Balneolaceae bacterium]